MIKHLLDFRAGFPAIVPIGTRVLTSLLTLKFSERRLGLCKTGLVMGCPHSNKQVFHVCNNRKSHCRIRRHCKHPVLLFSFPLQDFLLFIPPFFPLPLFGLSFISFYALSHPVILLKSEEGGRATHLGVAPLPLLKMPKVPTGLKRLGIPALESCFSADTVNIFT